MSNTANMNKSMKLAEAKCIAAELTPLSSAERNNLVTGAPVKGVRYEMGFFGVRRPGENIARIGTNGRSNDWERETFAESFAESTESFVIVPVVARREWLVLYWTSHRVAPYEGKHVNGEILLSIRGGNYYGNSFTLIRRPGANEGTLTAWGRTNAEARMEAARSFATPLEDVELITVKPRREWRVIYRRTRSIIPLDA